MQPSIDSNVEGGERIGDSPAPMCAGVRGGPWPWFFGCGPARQVG